MTLTTRLLMGAGQGPNVVLEARTFELSAPSSGGWTQVQMDRAVHYAGYTYYGYHDGQSGDNELRVYNHATGTTSSAFTLKAGIGGVEGSPDSHAAPVLLVRPSDHKLVAIYSGHATAQLWVRISANSLDSDPTISGGFGSETNLDGSLGKTAYTYPSAFWLANGDCHLFFRDTQGSGATETSVLCWAITTDGFATIGAATELVKRANFLPYWVIDSDNDERIDVLLMDGTGTSLGGSESPVKTWHMYYDGAWRKSDGTALGSTPYAPSSLSAVYDGSDGDTSHMWDVNTNGGSPRALVPIDLGTSTRYDWCRWTGSAWDCQTIATIASGDGTTAGLVFDHANPNVVYYTDFQSSKWEVIRAVTANNGATWTTLQLTSGSSYHNNGMTRVRNRASDLRALWFYGPLTSYLDYDVGTYGARR